MIRAVAITLLLILAPAAHGAIFGWTDSEGTAHYTNRESEIPPRYRDKAKLVVHEPTDSQTPQQIGQTQASPPLPARSEEPHSGVAQPVANPEPQNATGVMGGKKYIPRHRQHRQSGESTEEE